MADSTTQHPGHPLPGPKAPPGRWDGTSPGCLAAIAVVVVLVLGVVGFVVWNALFIGGFVADDPSCTRTGPRR